MSRRLKAYLALFVMSVIWGAALPLVKPALNFISPFQFLYLRFLLATPFLLPVLFHYWRRIKIKSGLILKIIGLEFFGTAINLPLLYYGLQLTSATEASLIGATGPIFVILGGILFLHEKQTRQEWLGLLFCFLGTLILVFKPSANFSLIGNLLIIGYNLIYVIYVLLAKVWYKKVPKIFISSLSYPIALISLFLILIFTGQSVSVASLSIPSVLLATVYMAIPGSIIAWTLFLYGQNLIEVSEASLFTYLQGIIALPVAWYFLNELPTPTMFFAIILIAGGVFWAEKRV